MALIVQKFGGTSVGDVNKIKAVAAHIAETISRGNQVVAVTSAMAGTTDRLLDLAREVCENPNLKEQDVLLATGEQVTAALLAIALIDKGINAASFVSFQIGLITNDEYFNAKIEGADPTFLMRAIERGITPVVAGYQGITKEHNISTLGRGGTDTTAVAIAHILKAEICEIYTDVAGVYTADPRLVDDAKNIKTLDYEQMMELASSGSKVLAARAVHYARRFNVPVIVKPIHLVGEGTLMTESQSGSRRSITGITSTDKIVNLTMVGIPRNEEVMGTLLAEMSRKNIRIELVGKTIVDGLDSCSFICSFSNLYQAYLIAKEVGESLGVQEIIYDDKTAKVSIVGCGLLHIPGLISIINTILNQEGIHFSQISLSESNISFIIPKQHLKLALDKLHKEFFIDKDYST